MELLVRRARSGVGRESGGRCSRRVAQIAVEQGAERLEWGVLKENAPTIGFYRALGATLVDDFMACRLEGETLRRVAAGPRARHSPILS